MKISSIVDIVDGELLNSPSISFINNISNDAKKVKTSDMFIAKNIEDLKIAITNGAYAVIFEKDFEVIDNEIAFIKVKNLELALLKIVRYKLSTLKIKSYFCTDETFDMLKLYQNNHTKPIFLISKNIEKVFKFIGDIAALEQINHSIRKHLRMHAQVFMPGELLENCIGDCSYA